MPILRVLSYSLEPGCVTDLDRIAAAVAPFDPDLLALQEVDLCSQARRLAERLGLAVHAERAGLATLARLPLIDVRHLPCALVTRHRWGHRELDLINTLLSPEALLTAIDDDAALAGPMISLDHLVIRGDLHVRRSGLWRGPGVRRASDQPPVFAELAAA